MHTCASPDEEGLGECMLDELKVSSHYDSQLCHIDFSGLEFSVVIVVMVICRSVELFIPRHNWPQLYKLIP